MNLDGLRLTTIFDKPDGISGNLQRDWREA